MSHEQAFCANAFQRSIRDLPEFRVELAGQVDTRLEKEYDLDMDAQSHSDSEDLWDGWEEFRSDDYRPEGHISTEAAGDLEGMSEYRRTGRRGHPRSTYSSSHNYNEGGRDERPTKYPLVEPMTHEGLTVEQVEKQLRMRRVLDHLREEDVRVLVDRFVSRLTLQDMAADRGITHQAIAKRLDVAKANFYVAFAKHWMDSLDTRYLNGLRSPLDVEFDPLPGQPDPDVDDD